MGTRHLICVVKDGQFKVAQYGQWDGYPSGQGVNILNFLREEMNKESFIKGIENCFEPSSKQINDWWAEVGYDVGTDGGFVDYETSKKYKDRHPSLSRDTGSDILKLIQESKESVPLNLSVEFAADSLFCEYAYVIDLDKNTFEVFKGFNTKPLLESERFYDVKNDGDTSHRETQYYPVRLIKEYKLDDLPTVELFLNELEPDDGSDA